MLQTQKRRFNAYHTPHQRKGGIRVSWFCHTCDKFITSGEMLSYCGRNFHRVKEYKKQEESK